MQTGIQNSTFKTQPSELRTQNSRLRTQNSKFNLQNSELRTQNSKFNLQNSKLSMGRRDGNIILCKAMDFAVRIVKLYNFLISEKKECVLSKQLLRSGTSIGANLNEAQESISQKEFEAKIYIALKEARETEYWLELLFRTDYLNKNEFDSINSDCSEILKILVTTTKTLRKK